MKTRTQEQKKLYKMFFLLLKFIPPFTTFILIIHAIVCILGYEECILDNLVRVSVLRALLMFLASYAFGFCWLHRTFVYFNLIVSVVIAIHNEWGLGILLRPCEYTTAIIGSIIMLLLCKNWLGFLKCNGYVEENYKWTIEKNR